MARAGLSGMRTIATEDVMPAGLILQFTGTGLDDYNRVNGLLGLDQQAGTGDWPAGILSHTAGVSDGGLVVVEVWESRDAQGRFMQERLGPALQKGGVTAVPTVTWFDVVANYQALGAAAG